MGLKISVVIPTRNRALPLKRCLKSFLYQTHFPEEIVVVDNHSSDLTPLVVKEMGKDLPLVYCREEKVSPSAARNRGIKLSLGDIIAFLDDDCLPATNWVANILSIHQKRPNIFLQGRSINVVHSSSFFNLLYYFHMERTLRAKIYSSLGKEKEGLVKFVDTKNLSFPRKLLVKNSLFLDESLPIYVEDSDLAIRTLNLGIPILYSPDVLVRHFIERTPRKFFQDRLMAGWAHVCLETKWGFPEKKQRWNNFSSAWMVKRKKFSEQIEEGILRRILRNKGFLFKLLFNLERKGEKALLSFLLILARFWRFPDSH